MFSLSCYLTPPTNLEMKVTRADFSDVEKLGKMNKRLIEDERHPNSMNVQQLTQRMTDWLQGEYICYLATEIALRLPIACSETIASITICDSCT